MPTDEPTEEGQKARWFPLTHWTDIVAARTEGSATASEALDRLCSTYWYPIYAYIRRRGHSDADAKDIAQGFFFHVLERNLLGSADRTKGKFRSFLLGALNYFLANHKDFERAKKRGGGATIISLDEKTGEERYALEPAVVHLRGEYCRQGKEQLFNQLKPFLITQTDAGDYAAIAQTLHMTPGAITTAVNRLRGRYGDFINTEIARTVAAPEDIPGERRYICELVCLANLSGEQPGRL
jgi:RNA polymerase sigma-70 factor (ECF subfamily)